MNQSGQEQKRAPKVSIGVPVYNGEKFIREALDSLVAQTFKDFELIISDNASTDGTEAICREYSERDPRIRYVRQGDNRGHEANFQFVLDEAVGKYFMWAAADDEWLPTFISECYKVLENNPDIGFVVTRYIVTSRFSPLLRRWWIPDLVCVTDTDRESRVLRFSSMPFTTFKDNLSYGLWRREAIVGILVELRQSPLGKILIGASMNEYALSLYKGGFVNEILFRKRYSYLPPGHILTPIAGFVSRIVYLLRGREREKGYLYNPEQHIKDLRVVLQRAGFDERYISRVIGANESHLYVHKGRS